MGPEQTIVLDLSEVELMDSSVLHVLVQARGRLTRDGGSLVLRNPSRVAHRLLTVAGANDLLETDAQDHPSDSN
jgi:anti-anti-sigma factor